MSLKRSTQRNRLTEDDLMSSFQIAIISITGDVKLLASSGQVSKLLYFNYVQAFDFISNTDFNKYLGTSNHPSLKRNSRSSSNKKYYFGYCLHCVNRRLKVI
jgi:hypothetical protein